MKEKGKGSPSLRELSAKVTEGGVKVRGRLLPAAEAATSLKEGGFKELINGVASKRREKAPSLRELSAKLTEGVRKEGGDDSFRELRGFGEKVRNSVSKKGKFIRTEKNITYTIVFGGLHVVAL